MGATFSSGRIAKAICDRCQVRHHHNKLMSDPNSPGLKVCSGCRDQFDPYRLSARMPDNFTLRFVRPDVPLIPNSTLLWDATGYYWDQSGLTWS